ncbi:two component hybrid sensor histidine kinase and regulator [Gluconacetobacter sacchari DSM 12717]|uniref:histidine kinase n=2 Tax=Gluconacetobacter sacchari TaxID=92759 RepID=A0A7W4IGI6_9PROT|nr:response regulator [Gluconacetobacter sacchari]MBB2162382.1 response regulator [Gluconacetobacter sacchari]GBQ23004.1 two component hybrid sensor histidine kinase and regulator [Gluconacetobacter sacchari DSM 12717]
MSGRPVVLLVDDEPEILVALSDLLEDGFTILSTTSPVEALEILARRRDVDVIVSDQRMPEMGGDVMLARARGMSDAQAILLTGYADIGAVAAALNQGRISFYSHKPWDGDALRAMVLQAAHRHMLEGELQTERMLLRGLLANLRAGLAFKDPEGRFIRINGNAAAFYGRDEADCLGRREEDLCDPALLPALRAAEGRLDAEGRDEEVIPVPGPGGSVAWREFTRVRLGLNARGEAYSVLINRDITRQREMEARLRQAEKMQALGTMAGGIAHDFNNLLTAVMGSLELAVDMGDGLDERTTHLLGNAMGAARRGADLTRRLLNFSRPRDLSLNPVDVNALLLGMRDLLVQGVTARRREGGASRPPVEIVIAEVDPAGEVPMVRTDAGQLELALLNLCLNASDAMPDGGMIGLSTRVARLEAPAAEDGDLPQGEYVVVSVADQGTGMAPETLARIFEPFFTTKDVGRGTGLGLSMIYGFVRHAGGDVRVASAPGEGTRVDLYLPVHRCPAADFDRPEAAGPPPVRRGLRVMVVDDEDTVRTVTAGFLRGMGHETIEADGGEEALARIAALAPGQPDLVVLDVMMPKMGGEEVARRIGALRPGTRILFLTGYADNAVLPEDALVLRKPFTQAELSGHVARAMGA